MRIRTVLPLLLALLACEDRSGGLSVESLPSILDATAASIKALEPTAKDVVACKVLGAARGALTSAASVARGALDATKGGDALLPAISVDVSSCGSLPAPVDVPAEVEKGLAIAQAMQPMLSVALDNAIPAEKCKLQAWVEAITPYAFTVGDAVLAEIVEPDGKVDIGAVTVALAACP